MTFIDMAVYENWNLMLKMSLQDYVTPGLNSIILKHTPAETLRLYVWEKGMSKLWNTDDPRDYSLAIHNHAFPFMSETLAGWQENLIFEEKSLDAESNAWTWNRYKYQSALLSPDGLMHLRPDGKANLQLTERQVYRAGEPFGMTARQLHRIKVPDDRAVVILFHEYSRENSNLLFYSPLKMREVPSIIGLYRPFNEEQLKKVLRIALHSIEVEPELV